MSEALFKDGYTSLLAFVRGDNVSMLRSVRASHRKKGKVFYLRLFGGSPVILGKLPMPIHPKPSLPVQEAPVVRAEAQNIATTSTRSAAATAAKQGQ
jgi:hypothetical protein